MTAEFKYSVETEKQTLKAYEIGMANQPLRVVALVVKDGSLFIPLVVAKENLNTQTDNRFIAAETNIATMYGTSAKDLFPKVANTVLGLPYYGQVDGVYCDGQRIDGLNGLHIYVTNSETTTEELINKLGKVNNDLVYSEVQI